MNLVHIYPLIYAVLSCLGLTVVYGATYVQFGQTWYRPMNQIGPLVLFVTCGWASYSLVRRSSLAIWTPMPWFLFACAAYYGLGPLAFPFGTAETVDYMVRDFPVDDYWLLRTNVLNTVGVAVVCATVAIGTAVFRFPFSSRGAGIQDYTKPIMWFFLAIGGTVKYAVTLPYALGLLPFVLPGSIQHLASLINAAIILLFVIIHRGDKKYYGLLYLVIGSELVAGLMTFSKLEVIMTVLSIMLGRFLCSPNLKRLILSGLAFAIFYAAVLSPFVLFARVAAGGFGVSDVNDLHDTVGEYNRIGKDALATLQPGVQGWWARLNYTPVQAFVMNLYDTGATGETFSVLPYVFVPRLLFENKPLMSSGKELTLLLTGDDSLGHTGVGVFGEAYWNGGWVMVACVSAYIGFLFSIFGQFSTTMLVEQKYAYLPVILIGVVMGLRPDDWFISTYVGSIIEAVVLLAVFAVIVMILRSWPVMIVGHHVRSHIRLS